MGMGARDRPFGGASPDIPKRDLAHLGRYTLAAVYATLADAEAATADLLEAGVDRRRIVVQDRRISDEGPVHRVVGPLAAQAPPTGEPVQTSIRRRDAEVAGVIFSRMVIWTAGATVVWAAIGFVIGLAFFGLQTETWIALAAAAVAGGVFGAMAGGIWGGMNQARREEGFLVEVHSDDPAQARRVADILQLRRPLRFDRVSADQELRGA